MYRVVQPEQREPRIVGPRKRWYILVECSCGTQRWMQVPMHVRAKKCWNCYAIDLAKRNRERTSHKIHDPVSLPDEVPEGRVQSTIHAQKASVEVCAPDQVSEMQKNAARRRWVR